jgi:transposase-like protein
VLLFQIGVAEKTVIDWYSFLRDVCAADLLAHPYQIGGVGHTVAIDESVIARRKPGNAQGRPVREQWVFGGVDLTTKSFFIELVDRRDAATLLPVIQRNILPGTVIWSDEWAAYNRLPAAGYPHQTVNHSVRYVDPITGCHTNDIESRWNACKAKFKARFGVPRGALASYLDEYMWRLRRERHMFFHDIIAAINEQYPL